MTSPNNLKWVKHSASTKDASWFDEYNDPTTVGEAVERIVQESLHTKFEESPPHITLPFMWREEDGDNGPCPDDPVTLYVHLPIMVNSDDRVIFSCSLEGVIDDMLETIRNMETGNVVDEEGRETCGLVAKRLRELADKLDEACK